MKILVVDDTKIIRKTIGGMLCDSYEVLEASDGNEAIAALDKNGDVSCILLDWVMEDISGIELLKRIRNTENLATTPVIMITSKNGSADVVEAFSNGVNDYMLKPIDKDTLMGKISKLVN